jgi:hypothetical protein
VKLYRSLRSPEGVSAGVLSAPNQASSAACAGVALNAASVGSGLGISAYHRYASFMYDRTQRRSSSSVPLPYRASRLPLPSRASGLSGAHLPA